MSHKSRKLLDRLQETQRRLGHRYKTELTYAGWVKRFIRFHKFDSEAEMVAEPGKAIEQFLGFLADEKRLSASSINQALNALTFTYTKVLNVQMPYLKIPHVKRTKNLQVALSGSEAHAVLSHLSGGEFLIVALMYGSGLRVKEACALRVQDLDLAHKQIVVRESKGGDHRVTILPEALIKPLQNHLKVVKYEHQKRLERRARIYIAADMQ